jgi:hypothetical protein
LGDITHLRFRYHLSGGDTMRVLLNNTTTKDEHGIDMKSLTTGSWAEAMVDFTADARRGDVPTAKLKKGERVNEIRFVLPKGAELLVDEVLLYEPAQAEGGN